MDRSQTTPSTPDQPLAPRSRWLGPAIKRLIPGSGEPAGSNLAFSAGGGGFRTGSRPEPPVRGGVPQMGGAGGGGPRMPRGAAPQGPRPERYWTDYLRIALPIIGLILMLSLFIFWVGSIINNNGDGDQTPTVPVALIENTAPPTPAGGQPTTTVAPPSAAASTGGGAGTEPTQAPSEQASAGQSAASGEPSQSAAADQATETPADEQPTDQPSSGGDGTTFAADDQVVVNDDNVNIRDAAGTDNALVVTVNSGDALTIVSGPESANNYDWYEVTTADGTDGWIASQFLDPA